MTIRIGLIGDHDSGVTAHQAIPKALDLAATATKTDVDYTWVPTDSIHSPDDVSTFDALWCVPASPYRSMDGALTAIRAARESDRPFLGTCGGFQHAVIEYARSVLNWTDAEHAETSPEVGRQVIAPLACSLVETEALVKFTPGSRLAEAYRARSAYEKYHCSYGLNPDFVAYLTSGSLCIAAVDNEGQVRALELESHPFFVITLFQPERAAFAGRVPPIVEAFVRAAVRERSAAGGAPVSPER